MSLSAIRARWSVLSAVNSNTTVGSGRFTPLVVRPDLQGRGIGRALVTDFEDVVRQRGGITLRLGTDDTEAMTTLSGVDLYPNVWEHVARIRNLRGHPYDFYLKVGFVITGVVPDANGPGKPDIIMSKRVSS